jgi:hypothetical protein
MSTKKILTVIHGDDKNTCAFCEMEYVIAESEAWEPENYCSGECEVLDEE